MGPLDGHRRHGTSRVSTREGGDSVNFKTVTWTAAAKVVDKNQTKGAPKNAIACKNKFAGVCLFPFILV
jgi:hypothetical protein